MAKFNNCEITLRRDNGDFIQIQNIDLLTITSFKETKALDTFNLNEINMSVAIRPTKRIFVFVENFEAPDFEADLDMKHKLEQIEEFIKNIISK